MAAIEPLLMLLEDLIARNDELEGQVQDLTLALGLDKASNVQSAFDVSESLAHLLILLSDGKPRSKEQLHGALYFRRPDVDSPEIKILDTLACKLRKCVRPYGIEIETIWSGGYRISAGLHVVQAAMEQASVADHMAREEARQKKRERERQWRRAVRTAQGGKDRQTYLQESLSRLKPWQTEGIARATWYRRRATNSKLAANDDILVSRTSVDSQVAA